MSTLENLRKSARRWLKALRADDADAHARLKRADPNAPSNPTLRDVQHALAREHGHKSWIDLRRALDDGKTRGAAIPDADQYDTLAKDVLTAYQTGDAAAMHCLQERFRRPSRSIAATLSWMRPCNGKRQRASMPGWLPLRLHHRRPPSLLSV